MRLIDIEDLYKQMRVNAEIESPLMLELITKFIQAVDRNIDDGFIPTVEAIPIEWIEKRLENIEDTLLEMSYRLLIEDWRKENGID